MVENAIKLLLFETDCVIIPGFGAFVCSYEGASISISKNKLSPPHKKIAYNAKLTFDDKKLSTKLSDLQNISKEEATVHIKNYTAYLQENLSKHKEIILEQIGKFYLNNENLIIFEQNNKYNYLSESFGLPELYFKPIDRTEAKKTNLKPQKLKIMAANNTERYEDEENEEISSSTDETINDEEYEDKKPKKNNLTLYYALAIVSFLVTAGTAYYINMDKQTYAIGSFNPLSWFQSESSEETDNKLLPESTEENTESTPEEVPVDEPTSPTPSTIARKPGNVPETLDLSGLITSSTGRFYVIGGSFSKPRKALNFKNKIIDDGLSPNIILPPGENTYKVSLADFASYEEATAKKNELKQIYGDDLWVFSY